jgi:hypothetical protein
VAPASAEPRAVLRRRVGILIAGGSAILLMAAYVLAYAPDLLPGVVLMLAGWGALYGGLRAAALPPVLPTIPQATRPRFYPIPLITGTITLLALAEASTNLLLPGLSLVAPVQLGLLCAGVVLVALGAGGLPAGLYLNRREVAVVALVALAGLGLRLWQTGESVRFLVDEIHFTQAVETLWAQPDTGLLLPFSEIAAFPYVFPYLQMISVDVFGRSLGGLRAASAILGALTLPAFYLLLRALLDRQTALAGLALLATFPPHLHFSRLGLNNVADPLFGILALAFFAWGLRRGHWHYYALGAVCLGLTQYFYEGGRLLFVPLALIWLAVFLRSRRLLLPIIGVAMLVAAPVYYTLLMGGRSVAVRMTTQHISLDGAYWLTVFSGGMIEHIEQHVLPTLLLYVRYIDDSLYYRGETALLLPLMAGFALVGMVYVLRYPRAAALLALWLAGATLGNSLLVNSIQSPRYVVVFPALVVLAALGVTHTVRLLAYPVRWQRPLMALMVLALAVLQAVYYFGDHLPVYNRQSRELWGHRDGQDAILRSLDFPPGTSIHIISHVPPATVYAEALLSFLSDDYELAVLSPHEVTPAYLQALPGDIDHAFYLEPDAVDVLAILHDYFHLAPPQTGALAERYRFDLYYAPAAP